LKDFYRPQFEEMEKSQLVEVSDKVGGKRKFDEIAAEKSEESTTVAIKSNDSTVSSDVLTKSNLEALSLRLGFAVEINKSTGRLKGINNMKLDSLRKLLEVFHIDTTGGTSELRTRLNEFIRLRKDDSIRI
jgi:hypothetical protein